MERDALVISGGTSVGGGGDEPVEEVAGAGEAWDDLYADLYPPMVRLAGLLMCDYQLGEEIAQDAFARLVETRDSVSDPASYVRATITNLCRSRIRRAVMARRQRTMVPPRAVGASLADLVANDVSIRVALRRLPQRQREAVVLRFYVDLSEAETASVMGVSVGSVKTHLHRAIRALSSRLEELR
jgi:RNA polymerase sigma-70 factor (sigma-E family)